MKKLFSTLLGVGILIGFSSNTDAATDITSSFSQTTLENAAVIAYYAYNEKEYGSTYPLGTGEFFAEKVRSGGDWDYKRTYLGSFTFDGKTVDGEYLGNMHYGYTGRAAGFSSALLRTAAGAYQIYSGTSYLGWYKSYFDDPDDQEAINDGISYWNLNTLPISSFSQTNTYTIMNEGENPLFDHLTEEKKDEIESQVEEDVEELEENNHEQR
ncbi:polymorphic toxin type 44 domain-containing protein [Alteribacillus bidgolensis]|uniref:Toxin 44 n=1 Tax=Alteribacillus bidgolensis TaxID=930129 RepID=A0A1G8RCV9_9BACI|nr:polymorphic toxin type 44 domain-containing protein [Alteribacillus bidgolensis]SDJ14832.1 toxin 44 [Alteribacillus bidgolensis]